MKVIVKKDVCIGCGTCPSICEEVFDIDDADGLAYVKIKDEDVEKEYEEDVKLAINSCPTGAIEEIENK